MSFFGMPRRQARFRWRGWDSPPAPQGPGSPADDRDDSTEEEYSRRDWDEDDEEDRTLFGLRWAGVELHHRSFTRRIETGSEAHLHVENRNGRITIRTHDQPEIVVAVEADVYAENSSGADAEQQRIERGITSDGNRVSVVAPDLTRPEWFFFGRGPKIDYEISVPVATQVWMTSRNGAVSLTGTRGRAHVESRNGRVTIERIEGDVEVDVRNGRVTVSQASGPVRVSAVNGPSTIERVSGAMEIESKNGPIDIEEAGSTVRAKTMNGSLRFRGRVNGDLDLEAANGGIRVAVTPDSRFEIDAESRHGSTRSDLPVRDREAPEGAGPAPKVRIRTVNGSIRLTEI